MLKLDQSVVPVDVFVKLLLAMNIKIISGYITTNFESAFHKFF